jgi:hypothetical protein
MTSHEVITMDMRIAGGDLLPPAPANFTPTILECCNDCSSEFMYPTAIEPAGDDKVFIDRKCPECDCEDVVAASHLMYEQYDVNLDYAQQALASAALWMAEVNSGPDSVPAAAFDESGLIPLEEL